MSQTQPQTPQAALNPRYARQHGCAWFDVEPGGDLNKAGIWAAVGGEPARRLYGIKDLDPQVLWWTNLNVAQTWMVGRLDRIKNTSLLGPSWTALLAEHGQEGDAASVALWSETFARMAEWLSEWARVADQGQPWAWGQGVLAETLADRWGWAVNPDQAPQPQPILDAAYQESVEFLPIGGNQQWSGRNYVTLSLPRTRHAQHMWAERVPAPGEHFTHVSPVLIPKSIDGALRWLQAQRQPMLVRVDHLDFLPGMAEIGRVWVGQRGRRFPAALPEPIWLTGEEAMDLSQLARFEIEAAYEAQHWHSERGPSAWTDDALDTPLGLHSTMLGLLGQSAWQAAATPTRAPQGRQRRAVTARAVWHRAADRRACFAAARRLIERGIPVARHGQGQVVIAMDPSWPIRDVAAQVQAAGLVLPRVLAQALPMGAGADADNPLDVAHWMARAGGLQAPWDLDRIIAPWLGKANEVLPLLRKAAGRLDAMDLSEVPQWSTWWRTSLRSQVAHTSERIKAAVQRRGRA